MNFVKLMCIGAILLLAANTGETYLMVCAILFLAGAVMIDLAYRDYNGRDDEE